MAFEQLRLIPRDSTDGQLIPYAIDFTDFQSQDENFRFRLGRNGVNEPVMLKLAYAGERARELLDHEWRIGKWLGEQGRDFVSTMVGHNPTSVPPYSVMTFRGSPLSQMDLPLDRETLRRVITGLLNGLEVLRASRVVHRRINLDTLCWDGVALQITDFTRAELDGTGEAVWHGDDVYAAGLVIYHLYTGELPEDDPSAMRARLAGQDGPLRELLGGRNRRPGTDWGGEVFADRAEDRPDARVLLDRWGDGAPRPPLRQARAYEEREREGRRNFAELRARQHAYHRRYHDWAPSWYQPIVPRPVSPQSSRTPHSRFVTPPFVTPDPVVVGAVTVAVILGVLILLIGFRVLA